MKRVKKDYGFIYNECYPYFNHHPRQRKVLKRWLQLIGLYKYFFFFLTKSDTKKKRKTEFVY